LCRLVFYQEKGVALFTGDALFIGDVGRPDLVASKGFTKEVSSMQLLEQKLTFIHQHLAATLYNTLRTKIKPLDDDIIIFPAHGPGSACGKNLVGNFRFRALD
jgi:glyoxylase-like metal-dependent hydrolase (beta-lactamase superfamily II)